MSDLIQITTDYLSTLVGKSPCEAKKLLNDMYYQVEQYKEMSRAKGEFLEVKRCENTLRKLDKISSNLNNLTLSLNKRRNN